MKLFSVLLLMVVLTGCGGREANIAVTDLPVPVRTAIQAQYPGAQLLSAEREIEKGVVKYEVEIEHNGQKIEVDVTEDGRLTVDG